MTHHSLIEQSKPYIKQASSQTMVNSTLSLKLRTIVASASLNDNGPKPRHGQRVFSCL